MKKLLILLATAAVATSGLAATFKMVAIPDSQRLARFNPAEMIGQTDWITNNVVSENIAFVTHLGDVVDDGSNITQWNNATDALDLLDGVVPYSVCMGNHDLHNTSDRLQGAAEYIDRFGSSRYSGYSWYGDTHRDLDHYQIFNADGRDWLHINFEYMPDSESLLWAQRVIDANPTLPVIVSTHAFLKWDGELGSNPNSSQMGSISNGGEAQWYQFVKQNDQIFLVMNGHYFDNGGTDLGVANTNIVNSYGHDVFMMCINFQGIADDDAHFRILEFDSASDEINATTYDPNTADYYTDADNQFTLSMDFSARLGSFTARETFPTIQAGNLLVVENDLNNSNNSVTVSFSASTADISVVPVGTTDYTDHSNGDYYLQVGTEIEDDRLGGIMLASVAESGRISGDGTNYYHVVAAPAGSHGQYWIAPHTTINESQYPGAPSGMERDVNVGVAYFPFDQGWTCGRVENYNNNTTNWTVVASENIKMGVNLTQIPQGDVDTNLLQRVGGSTAPYWNNPETYRGIWNLEIPGVDSISDGILLVCGGKNEDNYAGASPWRDGSGWQIQVQDSGSGAGTESDPWNFVYVPYSTENIVAGRVSNKSGITSGTGGFTIVSNAPGTVQLDIAGYTPSDGTLIVSTENEWYNNDDFTTYEPSGSSWLIQTRDLTGATPADAGSTQFAFLFIPFASAPSEPGETYNAFWTAASGDWMTAPNWSVNTYGVPGWVVGNPLNIGGSSDPDWNLAKAFIQEGVASLTPGSRPDGTVASLDVGFGTDSATLNISGDLSVRGETTMGQGSAIGTVSTINQTAGNVVLGTDEGVGHRTYLGRDDGNSFYNLSGGTLTLPADHDHFGRSGSGTFTFNMTGGTFSKPTGEQLQLGVDADTTGIMNMSAGTFDCSAFVWVGKTGHGEFNQTGGDARIQRLSMADNVGGTGVYKISGGSLVVTNGILGSQNESHTGKFTVSGSGATKIETRVLYAWDDVMRFELDAGGTTLIKVVEPAGAGKSSAAVYADFRRAIIEVDTLPGFNGTEGDVYDVVWAEDSVSTNAYDGLVRYGEPYTTLSNCNPAVSFKWRVVDKQVGGKDGQMLQLIVGANLDTRYVSALQKKFNIDSTGVAGAAGIAFDPTSQSGGVYDRVYLIDSSKDNAKEGLYAVDAVNETVSAKLMGDQGSRPYDVAVDASGNAYVCYGYAPAIWKLSDPLGVATEFQMLGYYGPSTDDDPDSLAMVPTGFGGGYNEGADLILFDADFDQQGGGGQRAISIVDKDSTSSNQVFTTISQETSDSYRVDGSEYDGNIYFTHYHPEIANLNGSNLVYIVRMDHAGARERIFLDVDPADVAKLDDTLAVNPVDGSVWMGFYSATEGDIRTIYRVDVANAVLAQGVSDYLAPTDRVIYNVGFNNIGKNGMAISPDGLQLALVNPNSADMMAIFDIHAEVNQYDAWAEGYGLSGTNALMTADPDGDDLDNLSEYALGGDPSDPLDVGMTPVESLYSDGGGDWMNYVYPKRSHLNSGISYTMEVNDNLIYGTWTNANYESMGTGFIDADFNSVTNRIPTDVEDEQFIRLRIEEE